MSDLDFRTNHLQDLSWLLNRQKNRAYKSSKISETQTVYLHRLNSSDSSFVAICFSLILELSLQDESNWRLISESNFSSFLSVTRETICNKTSFSKIFLGDLALIFIFKIDVSS